MIRVKAKDRVGNEIHEGDFVVYVTAGDRHPVLEFGWVEKFHESKTWNSQPSGNFKIKIQRAHPNGSRITKQAVDVAGHWRDETPEHIVKGRVNGQYYWPTGAERDQFYVATTYFDTGLAETTMLDLSVGDDRRNNRLLVTQPI